jgi:hypothetical protein
MYTTARILLIAFAMIGTLKVNVLATTTIVYPTECFRPTSRMCRLRSTRGGTVLLKATDSVGASACFQFRHSPAYCPLPSCNNQYERLHRG